ncbi:MAG: DUF1275 domain-containing protein [Alphaproteobacteria bacterium]|nr:MAG: DUF1275 domain-containing protein [Alphaproteobacteria bacterium]
MTRYDRRSIALAVGLSSLAGYVDAFGFLSSGRFFVSFMSGNSTRLGIDVGRAMFRPALVAAGVVVLFVLGVVLGNLVAHGRDKGRRPTVLLLVAFILALSAGFHGLGFSLLGTGLLLIAMGAENAVFHRDGEVSIGLTYMTGTLVKLGQRLTAAIMGGPRWEWIPYLLLWTGLVTGAALGAFIQLRLSMHGLWLAVPAALLLASFSVRTSPE